MTAHWCVAQCRPNTASTVLFSDVVGTIVDAQDIPLVAATFDSGAIARVDPSLDSPEHDLEAVPVRHDNRVVAVLTHQTALARRRTSSPLEKRPISIVRATCCTC